MRQEQERVEVTREMVLEAYRRLVKAGQDQSRPEALAVTKAMVHAVTQALINPGCEVRVTAESTERAVFYFESLKRILTLQDQLDEEATRLCQVEVKNGSCILVGVGDEQAG